MKLNITAQTKQLMKTPNKTQLNISKHQLVQAL